MTAFYNLTSGTYTLNSIAICNASWTIEESCATQEFDCSSLTSALVAPGTVSFSGSVTGIPADDTAGTFDRYAQGTVVPLVIVTKPSTGGTITTTATTGVIINSIVKNITNKGYTTYDIQWTGVGTFTEVIT